LQLNQIS
jgi:hypothetical protein